jgi:dCMP deaminase
MKRNDYISWDTYFMGVAMLSSMRSKDPSTQVGACIVNDKKRIIGIGYNGFPYGCEDDAFPWENNNSYLESKYPYVVHAEPNAILNASCSLEGATLYVTLFPCNECAKLIIQSGIREIVYLSDKYNGTESDIASKRMFEAAKVKTRKMMPFHLDLHEGEV